MEVAASDPPTPMPPVPAVPHVEMKDSDLLIDVADRIKEAQMAAAATPREAETPLDDRPSKVPRIAGLVLKFAKEFPINDEVLALGESAQEEWDIPEDAKYWQVLVDEDSFCFDSIPFLTCLSKN